MLTITYIQCYIILLFASNPYWHTQTNSVCKLDAGLTFGCPLSMM
jgi:hypothetical protein